MIDLYTWSTPNGRKVSIALEEMECEYKAFPINIMKDEQFAPDFLKIAPNNRIPAIVDHDNNGYHLMESGAILLYLAEKTGKFLPKDEDAKWRAIEWLMWQMGGFGPMLGQAHHFLQFNKDKAPYAEQRYHKEAQRLYGVLEKQLSNTDFIAGEYSIADMAVWPWMNRFEWQQIDLNDYPNIKRWYQTIAERPAVQRGFNVPVPQDGIPMPA